MPQGVAAASSFRVPYLRVRMDCHPRLSRTACAPVCSGTRYTDLSGLWEVRASGATTIGVRLSDTPFGSCTTRVHNLLCLWALSFGALEAVSCRAAAASSRGLRGSLRRVQIGRPPGRPVHRSNSSPQLLSLAVPPVQWFRLSVQQPRRSSSSSRAAAASVLRLTSVRVALARQWTV